MSYFRAVQKASGGKMGSLPTAVGMFAFRNAASEYSALAVPTTSSVKKLKKPKPWKHSEAITRAQLRKMRDEFWDTAPHYGGNTEIWDALHAAAEAQLNLAQAIIDSAGIIVTSEDMSVCYDERGAKYDLPKYVLSEPVNIIKDD